MTGTNVVMDYMEFQAGMVWCGVEWCIILLCGVVWSGIVLCGIVWCGMVWYGIVWCGISRDSIV